MWLSLIAQISTESPGMDQDVYKWIVGALGALALYEKLTKLFGKSPPDKREISGSIATKPESVPADKSEVDEELETINKNITKLSEKLDVKVAEIMKAGQDRADTITSRIDAEVKAIRDDMHLRIQQVHDRIANANAKDAAHDEAIGTLKVTQNMHTNQISQISQKLPKSRLP